MKKEKQKQSPNYFLAITATITLVVMSALILVYDFFKINNYWLAGSIIVIHVLEAILVCYNFKSQKIKTAIVAIDSITNDANYTNFFRIEEARKKYESLSAKDKRKVLNYALLVDAEIAREYILKIWALEKATSIPNVKKLQNIQDNYNHLTEGQKCRITNISVIYKLIEAYNISRRIELEHQKCKKRGDCFENETEEILKQIRNDFNELPIDYQHKVSNYELLLIMEKELQNQKESEKRVLELIEKIEEIESIFHEEEAAKVWNIDADELFFNVLMNAKEFYDSLDQDCQSRVANFSSLTHMIDLIRQKLDIKGNEDFNINKLRVLCPKRELRKLDGEKEKLMHALTKYCQEFSKHNQRKYKEEFEHWINYFMNIHLDYLPVNPNSFLFALTVGEYYYHIEHSLQSALKWFEKAKGLFESSQWDLSNYAKRASVMYKVMADIVDDEDEKLRYYKMSFFCDTDNKEIYGILMEKDPDNKRMYLQYKNKRSPFNWENIKNIGSEAWGIVDKVMSSEAVEKIPTIIEAFVSN